LLEMNHIRTLLDHRGQMLIDFCERNGLIALVISYVESAS
jgi:hypothetical protein